MAIETTFFRSLLQPLFIRRDDKEEPRKVRWIGKKEPAPINTGGNKSVQPPERKTKRGYRNLASITLGEVNDAYKLFADQLVPNANPTWIAPNTFYMIELVQDREDRPPAIFGRVRTCYPSDGHIQNIQEMELHLPRKGDAPDLVHLRAGEITGQVQGYLLQVKFHITKEEILDFSGSEIHFIQQGFSQEFIASYLDFLEIDEGDQATFPPLLLISSRWYASAPESLKPEIREKLTRLVSRNKLIFDYHPDHLPAEIRMLNKELGLKAGFSEVFLVEPETPGQTLQIIQRQFGAYFTKPGI